MKVIDLDAYRRARERAEEEPGINWAMIVGIAGSIACWTGVGWAIWRIIH